MIIAIDFDQTYTADPDMWDSVIELMKQGEHTVYCVTCRAEFDTHGMDRMEMLIGTDHVFYTDNMPKIEFMEQQGYHVDIWIDDCPATVTGGGKIMWRKSENPNLPDLYD